jgi:glycosyltransferase involved in cell wall biosynthesis
MTSPGQSSGQPPPRDTGPLVSVLIPAFNYGRYLGETLRSVQAQSYTNWECIVVDDGSTDDTPDVATRFSANDARVRVARQPNRGQPAARNHALRLSRGDYVQLLDADDLIESGKLASQVGFLESRLDVDIVYGDVRYFPTDRPLERLHALVGPDQPWMPRTSGAGPEVLRALVEKNIMVINSPLTRRRALDDVGPFDESLPRADDWDMWVRCALAGKRFEYRDPPGTLALVRSHPASLTKRDRRLLASSLAIHRKVAASSLPPANDRGVREVNNATIGWLERVCQLASEIDAIIPADCPFILIDEDRVRPELLGYRAIPFTEQNGEYWGPPPNSAEGVREVERLRSVADAKFLCFAWTATWYLDYYDAFREYLQARHVLVARSHNLIVYRLCAGS